MIVIVLISTRSIEIPPPSSNLRVRVVGISAAKEPISMTALSTPRASALILPSDCFFGITILAPGVDTEFSSVIASIIFSDSATVTVPTDVFVSSILFFFSR